jgi:hypothetical protein
VKAGCAGALLLAACTLGGARAEAAPAPPRLLVLGIDAIPYAVAAAVTDPALGERMLFRGMQGPAAVVSSFPSTSYPAWSKLLAPFGVQPPPGYIGKYYAEEEHRVLGVASAEHEEAPWLEFFDWRLEGLLAKAAAYGNSRRASINELERGLAAFAASDKPVYWLYLLSTDALGHEYGPPALAGFLAEVDAALARLRASMPERPFHTVLVSDHGMAGGSELVNAWPAVRAAMQRAGFRDVRRLGRPGDAIFVPLGILSFFFVHLWPGDEARAAEVLASVPGIDLCVRPDGGGWQVRSRDGAAVIRRRVDGGRTLWSYEAQAGDPLGYAATLATLRARGGGADAAWFPDDSWFDATLAARYPDALHRIAGAFEGVRNPASLLCSLDSGHMFAARGPELLARGTIGPVEWTHGALTGEATLGMLLSDLPGWQPRAAVRAERALEFLLPQVADSKRLAGP